MEEEEMEEEEFEVEEDDIDDEAAFVEAWYAGGRDRTDDRDGLGGGAGFTVKTPLGGSGGGTQADFIISMCLAAIRDGLELLDVEVKLAVFDSRKDS